MDPVPAPARAMMPLRRGRCRRRAKWAGVVLSVLIAAAGVASIWLGFGFQVSHEEAVGRISRHISFFRGSLVYDRSISEPTSFPTRWQVYMMPALRMRIHWWPGTLGSGSFTSTSFPLWIPFVLIAVPTTILMYRDRASARRRRAGECVKCGYALAGLAPGAVCPECGTAGRVDACEGKVAADQRG